MSEEWIIHKPREIVSRGIRMEPRKTTIKQEDPLEKLKKLKELYDMGCSLRRSMKKRERNF